MVTTNPNPNVGPVRPGAHFDEGSLTDYLERRLTPWKGPLHIEQFLSGQSNPTYLLDLGNERVVLRKRPVGAVAPSAHRVDREYRVLRALHNSPIPVPRTYFLCEDDSVVGSPFFLMEYIEGRTFADRTLPGLTVAERTQVFAQANGILAALHTLDYKALGLQGFGNPQFFLARQVDRWSEQYRASATEPIPAMDHLMERLPEHLPPEQPGAPLHGDFHLSNVILHPTEARIIALLDWELSTIGDPLSDLAYHLAYWRLPQALRGIAGADLPALGIPSEADYLASYCAATKRTPPPEWDWYIAFNLFRIAAIRQGILARSRQGNATSANAEQVGAQARQVADLAWETLQAYLKR